MAVPSHRHPLPLPPPTPSMFVWRERERHSPLASPLIMLWLVFLLVLLLLVHHLTRPSSRRRATQPPPPGPKPWPVYGCLHLLARDANPWEAFRRLKERYGDVYGVRLGSQECVVVSSIDAIREVLVKKSLAFSARPNFLRYHALFGGNRNNSLALCDWSDLQKKRRDIAYPYVFPRPDYLPVLEAVIEYELNEYFDSLFAQPKLPVVAFDKPQFSAVCANIFYSYFCSKRYSYADGYFMGMVKRYDVIFHDINNGFALDFMPWLFPFKLFHLSKLYLSGQYVRRFLNRTLINCRLSEVGSIDPHNPRDFLDALITRSQQQQRPNAEDAEEEDSSTSSPKAHWWTTLFHWAKWLFNACFMSPGRKVRSRVRLSKDDALYELEDLLGGHSAVACFFSRMVAQIVNRPDVKHRIRQEVDEVMQLDGEVRLRHKSQMPYIQAVIWETLRVTTSPIVPHVAVDDANISGFHVKKGSIIFLNNYYLNLSDKYWKEPQNFDPDRFFNGEGSVRKPDHFLPFSAGQRSCLGFQLLYAVVFLATCKLFTHCDLTSTPTPPAPPTTTSSNTLTVPHQPLTRRISRDVECAKLSVHDTDVKAFLTHRFRPHNNTPPPLIIEPQLAA